MLSSRVIDDFQTQISQSFRVEIHDGLHRIASPFYFADGDGVVIALVEDGVGELSLSDTGNTLFRAHYEAVYQNKDAQREIKRILAAAGISRRRDEFIKPLPDKWPAEAVCEFARALLKIDDMSLFPAQSFQATPPAAAKRDALAPVAGSAPPRRPSHKAEVGRLIEDVLPAHRVSRDWTHPERDRSRAYPIDFKIDGKAGALFLHAPGRKTDAQDAAITAYRLKGLGIIGRHVAVLRGDAALKERTITQLNDVCEVTFGNLELERHNIKKFLREAAAD